MTTWLTRRLLVRAAAWCSAWLAWPLRTRAQSQDLRPRDRLDDWDRVADRIWLGEKFWANPMEGWRVDGGTAECVQDGGERNLHLLTHQLRGPEAFALSVRIQRVQVGERDGGVGFRVGVRSDVDDFKSNCFARGGLIAGAYSDRLQIGEASQPVDLRNALSDELELRLEADRELATRRRIRLEAFDSNGRSLASVEHEVDARAVSGNIALHNDFASQEVSSGGARHRFRDLRAAGEGFEIDHEREFGPILWSMYAISHTPSDEGTLLKLTAQLPPLEREALEHPLVLRVERDGEWQAVAEADLDPDSWSALFRVPRWDATRSAPFEIVLTLPEADGTLKQFVRRGQFRAEPARRPLRLAALTCQHHSGFPYGPVAHAVLERDPDLVYFSGDQLYESHGGFGLIRDPAEPAILNYLRKYYLFGWAFGELIRDRPSLCIPDDHDVFQGNLWGESGAPMARHDRGTSSLGGYREPARMVNVVHRTQSGHHPDPHDSESVRQGISVYYGTLVWGGVGFAILADRQFKSGPEHVDTGEGRADHVLGPNFDVERLDVEGLELLGPRQERFLEQWADDWRGHRIKVALSQTVFGGLATHHGAPDDYLQADLDCGGWPQSARQRAIGLLRKARCLHVCGDQHLPSLVQYGHQRQRDSNWCFCVPAISAGYPRWWRPDDIGVQHRNRPDHGLSNTGEYRDGLGNRVFVYAIGNPEVGRARDRYERAHQKSSGFGWVEIDGESQEYRIEAYRFLGGSAGEQFPGWPVTVQVAENQGHNPVD